MNQPSGHVEGKTWLMPTVSLFYNTGALGHCLGLPVSSISAVFVRIRLVFASVSVLLFLLPMVAGATTPNRPFPQHVVYAAGSIRPSHFTQAQQDQHVRDFYTYWKRRYLVAAGTNAAGKALYRVAFALGSPVTVSEGQGYGMVVMALMAGHDPDAQRLFDGLWHFSRQYPSGVDPHLMSWKVQGGVVVEGNDSAFDGDVDIAYGLLLAHEQWGSQGQVNYQAEARQVMDAILVSTIGKASFLPKLGDWTQDDGGLYNQYTPRSSDFMPAHFRAFAKASGNPVWQKVIGRSQAVIDSIQTHYSPVTGLLPDFIIDCQSLDLCRPAYSGFLEGSTDGAYHYNAGRAPWRIGLDALLDNDAKSKAQTLKMVRWLASTSSGSAKNIKAGYQVDGLPIGDYSSSFFMAPVGVGAMLEASQQDFLNDIYTLVYKRHEGYYEDSVNLLSLLVLTGNYWRPGSVPDRDETTVTANQPLVVQTSRFSDWGAAYCALVTVSNANAVAVDWQVGLAAEGDVYRVWNASYTQTGKKVVAQGLDWNNLLPPHQSLDFGFCAKRPVAAVPH